MGGDGVDVGVNRDEEISEKFLIVVSLWTFKTTGGFFSFLIKSL